MDDAQRLARLGIIEVMGVRQGLADLHHDVERLADRQPLPHRLDRLQQHLEVAAVDVLHDQEVRRVLTGSCRAHVVDEHDVGVLQVQRQARLVEKHLHEALVLGQVGQNALDGDRALEATDRRLGDAAKDLRHTAGVESVCDFIALGIHLLTYVATTDRPSERWQGKLRVGRVLAQSYHSSSM